MAWPMDARIQPGHKTDLAGKESEGIAIEILIGAQAFKLQSDRILTMLRYG